MYYSDKPVLARDPVDIQWRADEYKRLRTELKMPRPELAKLIGLSVKTLNQYPYVKRNKVPSLMVLERMRAALEFKQYRAHIDDWTWEMLAD